MTTDTLLTEAADVLGVYAASYAAMGGPMSKDKVRELERQLREREGHERRSTSSATDPMPKGDCGCGIGLCTKRTDGSCRIEAVRSFPTPAIREREAKAEGLDAARLEAFRKVIHIAEILSADVPVTTEMRRFISEARDAYNVLATKPGDGESR